MMGRKFGVLTAGMLVFAGMATAQSPKEKIEPGSDAKKLGVFVGKWTLEGDVTPGALGPGPGGKITGTESCEWMPGNYAVLCRDTQTVPDMKETHVTLMTYDADLGNYVFFRISNIGRAMTMRGTVDGDTWTWKGEHTLKSKTRQLQITQKWTSANSFEFKNEAGSPDDILRPVMQGKQSRVTAGAKPKTH